MSEIDLTEPDVSKFKDLKKKISIKLDDVKEQLSCISGFRQTVKDIDSQLKDLEQHVGDDSIECPHCENLFILQGDNALTVDELNQKISAKMEKLNGRRDKLVARINHESNLISQRDELNDLIHKADDKYRLNSAGYLKNRERYVEIKSKIDVRKSKIEMLSNTLDKIKGTKAQIEELKKYKKEQESILGGIAKEVETHKALLSVFAPTGAPAYVLDSVIDLFNERVADYVAMIWPNASYELLSYKENKNKTIKAKLSDSLIINGKSVSIGSLSGGELRCLCLSIDFALVEMVEAIGSINISPYVLDEPFEGLDAANRERAVDMLDRLSQSRQVWVIDHQSEAKAMFSDIVKIEKRNGISKCLAN